MVLGRQNETCFMKVRLSIMSNVAGGPSKQRASMRSLYFTCWKSWFQWMRLQLSLGHKSTCSWRNLVYGITSDSSTIGSALGKDHKVFYLACSEQLRQIEMSWDERTMSCLWHWLIIKLRKHGNLFQKIAYQDSGLLMTVLLLLLLCVTTTTAASLTSSFPTPRPVLFSGRSCCFSKAFWLVI